MDKYNTNSSKSSRLNTASNAKCRSGALDSCSISEKLVLDKRELEWIGRGFISRIAFWTITRFAQERAHSRNTRFSLTQSSRPTTRHRSAFAGSRVSRNDK